jgi:hypothetical protein
MVGLAISPNATKPALDGSITSAATCLAMASAIWLRQELPMHKNKTLVRCAIRNLLAGPAKQNDTERSKAQAGRRSIDFRLCAYPAFLNRKKTDEETWSHRPPTFSEFMPI